MPTIYKENMKVCMSDLRVFGFCFLYKLFFLYKHSRKPVGKGFISVLSPNQLLIGIFYLNLHKISCTRQTESKLSFVLVCIIFA